MGNGIKNIEFCCKRDIGNEPEIKSKKEIKKNPTNFQIISSKEDNQSQKNSEINSPIFDDDKRQFYNNIKKIGNILSIDSFINNLPEYIKHYIKENPYELLDIKNNNKILSFPIETEKIKLENPVEFNNNRNIYTGEWTKDGLINGKGKMYKPSSKMFLEGDWINGDQKYGRIISYSGIYVGSIEKGEFHGKGKFIDSTGNSYEGNWLHGQKHGQGVVQYSDGCVYSGMFENNEIQGQGEFTWNDGNYYKGEFLKSVFNGKGLFRASNGNIYNGNFCNGYFHGEGIFFWSIYDEYYKGEYRFGQKNGKGLYKFKNGNIYMGQWCSNKSSGKGTFETKNKIYSGIWNDGHLEELLDVVSKYQTGEINENIEMNFNTKIEDIDFSSLKHLNIQ